MSTEEAQQRIARLYLERNQLYRTLPGARLILNLGCGSGSFPKNYEDRHCLIVNVDRDEKVAGYPAYGPANRGFRGFAELDVEVDRCINVKRDVMDLHRFPSGVFDMVVAGQLIEHFKSRDLEWLLHEIHRVLAPGGRIQLDTVTDRLGESLEEHEAHFTADSVHDLLTRFGFQRMALQDFAEGTAVWAVYRK